MTPENNRFRATASGIALVVLLLGCLMVLRPFISALLWAVVLCFSSWRIYERLLALVGQRHTLAALIMTLTTALVLLLPFVIVGLSLGDNVKALTVATQKWIEAGPPQPPAWLAKVPAVGQQATTYWHELAGDSKRLAQEAQKLIEPVSAWLLSGGIKLGQGMAELAMSIFIAFFLFRDGTTAAERVKAGVARIAGEDGQRLLELAGKTVRSVVYGILGTALAQGVVAGIGFLIAGVPGALLLALLTFFLSLVPVGPPLVWIPASIWLFNQGHTGWGVFMIIWGVAVISSVDNFVKPWLISQGSNLPFILILFGVLGGALAFGFIGVFLGPTLLAVGFKLIQEWAVISSDGTSPIAAAPAPAAERQE
jgi:predicted PurR-regulated permease PerM